MVLVGPPRTQQTIDRRFALARGFEVRIAQAARIGDVYLLKTFVAFQYKAHGLFPTLCGLDCGTQAVFGVGIAVDGNDFGAVDNIGLKSRTVP